MQSWTPQQLATALDTAPDSFLLLDVRELWEYQLAHLDPSRLIPLGELLHGMKTLDKSRPIAVLCHHGIRSAHACYLLERSGFQTINISGGIDRWAREINHSMPVY